MPKPNKMQVSYVETHLDLTDGELSKITGLSVKTVKNFRAKLTEVVNGPTTPEIDPVQAHINEVTVAAKKPAIKAGDLMSRRAGATIMTEAAAQISDENSKTYRNQKDKSDHILRIR